MSVHQTSDGRWYVRFRKGKIAEKPNATKEYFGRGLDAENATRIRNRELNLGLVTADFGKSFEDIAIYFLKAKVGGIEENSYDTAYMHLDKHLNLFFGSADISEINEDMVDQYVRHRMTEKWYPGNNRAGKARFGVTRSTVRRELEPLQAVLNFAARRKVISHNPIIHHEKPKENDAVIFSATMAEITAIIKESPSHLQRFIIIAYYSVVRPGEAELLTMRWSQIDIPGQIVFVVSARKGGLV